MNPTGPLADSTDAELYNRVLEFLVDADDPEKMDVVGVLACGLAKLRKRNRMVRFRQANGGLRPNDAETAAVTHNDLTASMRHTLRVQASDILTAYADTYLQASSPQIREAAIAGEALRQARAIEGSIQQHDRCWHQVTVALVATGIWTFLLVGSFLTLRYVGVPLPS